MTTSSPNHSDRRFLALGLRLLAALTLSCMFVLVKIASERSISVPEIMFWRQFFAIPVVLGWISMTTGLGTLKTSRFPDHAKRSALGLSGMVFNFLGFSLLPMAEATTMGFTVPIFATILSALILKEQVGKHRWSAVLIGFLGVIIVLRPGDSVFPLNGALAGLIASMLVALVSIQIRDLSRTEPSPTIVFYFSALSCIPLGLMLPFFWVPHNANDWLVLVGLGLSGGVGQIFVTASLKLAPVSTVVGMDYSSLLWATLFGWLIWDHMPPESTWFGAPLIIASGLYIVWREHRLAVSRSREVAA